MAEIPNLLILVHLPEEYPWVKKYCLSVIVDFENEMTMINPAGEYTCTPGELLPFHYGLVFFDSEFGHVMRLQYPFRPVGPAVDAAPAVVVVSHLQTVEIEVIMDVQRRPQWSSDGVVDI
jgi:hypothetical protein